MNAAALIIVNYKTASLAINAIRSARAGTSRSLQVVAVDNSMDPSEAEALRPHADILVVAERNLGYAAAINRARSHCDAEVLIVSNPDVVFGPASLDRLIEVDAAVAGPALYWDEGFEWVLPPSELHSAGEVLDRALASRSHAWQRLRDRRRIARRLRFWSLRNETGVEALSGAVLAVRASAFDTAGGFDERFHLYFEENDFLKRVKGPIVYVPDARCRHLYNQSAGQTDGAASFYKASQEAYLEKWNGRLMARAIKRLERPLPPVQAVPIGSDPIEAPSNSWIEASPLPSFDTAAGHLPRSSRVVIPASIWDVYRDPTLYLRVIDRDTGSVLATYARSKIGR